VVEVEHDNVCLAAILAPGSLETEQDMISRPLDPPPLARLDLCAMPSPTLSEVCLEAFSTPVLPSRSGVSAEELDRPPPLAAAARLCGPREDLKAPPRLLLRLRDVTDPHTHA